MDETKLSHGPLILHVSRWVRASCGAPLACRPPAESGPQQREQSKQTAGASDSGNTPSREQPTSPRDFFWGPRLLGDLSQIQDLIQSRTGELVGLYHWQHLGTSWQHLQNQPPSPSSRHTTVLPALSWVTCRWPN